MASGIIDEGCNVLSSDVSCVSQNVKNSAEAANALSEHSFAR